MLNQEFIITENLLASKNKRFANYLLDLIPQYAFFYALAYLFFYIGELTGDYTLNNFLAELTTFQDYAFSYAFFITYYFSMEALTQKTLGKYITNTMVVLKNGEKPTTQDFLIRSLCRIIPFNAFSFLGEKGKGWHDSLSKTYVVSVDKFEAKKTQELELTQIGMQPDAEDV